MSSNEFMKNVQYFMNTQKAPMYTADQFMQLQKDYLQGPMTPYVDGTLPAPTAPPPQPEVTYYGGYGGVPWYGRGGGGGGGYGGGGSYLPGAYSPFNYGQGVEQPGREYGSALNLSLWNI